MTTGDISPSEKAQKLKKQGNDNFQKGQIEQAIEAYTSALNILSDLKDPKDDGVSFQMATLFSNRAACYLKISGNDTSSEENCARDDCTQALGLLESISSIDKEPLRKKLLYRRARANASEQPNEAAKDLLEVLRLDPQNKESTTLLNTLRAQHSIKNKSNTPMSKALRPIRDHCSEYTPDMEETMTKHIKVVHALLQHDLENNSMELGRTGGLALLLNLSEHLRQDSNSVELQTRTLQCISCACSHAPFVKTFIRAKDEAIMVLLRKFSVHTDIVSDRIVVATLSILLRLILNLQNDEESMKDAKSVPDAQGVVKICVEALQPTKGTEAQRAALEVISTWAAMDRSAAASVMQQEDALKKKSEELPDFNRMTPRQVAAYRKHEHELKQHTQKRAKRHALLLLDGTGTEALLSCAVTTKDHVLRREVGVVLGRLLSVVDDDNTVKRIVGPLLGYTGEETKGLTIEEITEEDEEYCENEGAQTKFLRQEMERGQLVASVFLATVELGTWALGTAWSLDNLCLLIDSKNRDAMAIASEVVAAAASAEKARPLISSLLNKGSLEKLLSSEYREIRSGAATAVAKLGMADKVLSKNEGEIMGLLQLAVELLDDDEEALGSSEKPTGMLSNNASTAAERGVEVLSYLVSRTHAKEELVHGLITSPQSSQNALERLVTLSCRPGAGESVSAYGLATIFALLSVSIETLRHEAFVGKDITAEQYDELQALGKTEEEKEMDRNKEDDDPPEAVRARIQKMANCGVARALVKLTEGASETTLEQVMLGMSRMAVEESIRGIMIQQGCLSACLKVEKGESPTEIAKQTLRQARHCVAKMLVTTNPSLLTVSQRLGSVKPLLQLIKDSEATDLAQFEALLSITNIASIDDESKGKIVSEKGIPTLKYAMFSDHEMVRRAATEALCNLVQHPEMRSHLAHTENLKLWVAFACEYEKNFECARAAAGCLAMATQYREVAVALASLGGDRYKDLTTTLLECGNLELMHRCLAIVLNLLLEDEEKCKTATVETGAVAFCLAYVDSYHDGTLAKELNLSDSDKELMQVTLDMAKQVAQFKDS